MPRTFEVTTTTNTIEIGPGEETQVEFTVTNRSAEPVDGRASLSVDEDTPEPRPQVNFAPADDAEPDSETPMSAQRRFSANGTEKIAVSVSVPTEAANGVYPFQLTVADVRTPATDWTQSAPVAVQVVDGDRIDDDEDGPNVPLIIGLIVGGLVLAGGLSVLIWYLVRDTSPDYREACTDECDDKLVCVQTADSEKLCLRADGETCAESEECAGSCIEEACTSLGSLQQPCVEGKCAEGLTCHEQTCLIPDGAACVGGDECVGQYCLADPTAEDTELKTCRAVPQSGDQCLPGGLCAGGLACASDNRCLGPVGHSPCASNAACTTGFCLRGKCAPRPGIGDSCAGSACPAPFQCRSGKCVAAVGVAGCSEHSHCTTGFCKRGTCAEPGTNRCTKDGDCATGQKCGNAEGIRVCQWKDGGQCVLDSECLSGICSAGRCRKYTGGCVRDDHCRDGEVCAGGKCKRRKGAICSSHAQCSTNNCDRGRCANYAKCRKCKADEWCKAGRCQKRILWRPLDNPRMTPRVIDRMRRIERKP